MMISKTNPYVIFFTILFVCCIIFFCFTNCGYGAKLQVAKVKNVESQKVNDNLFADKLHSLIKKISTAECFSQEEEVFYFGEDGINNLGRSLSKYEKHCIQNKCNTLGQMVIDKLYPLLVGYDVYEYFFGDVKVADCTDGTLRGGGGYVGVTVVFRDTNHKKEDLCFIFNLYIPQEDPENFYIRLHLSYLNGIPLWNVLGFTRHERIWGEFYPPQV